MRVYNGLMLLTPTQNQSADEFLQQITRGQGPQLCECVNRQMHAIKCAHGYIVEPARELESSDDIALPLIEKRMHAADFRYTNNDEWLVNEMWPDYTEATIISGAMGSLKSYIALAWAIEVSMHRPVLYFYSEGKAGLKQRLESMGATDTREDGLPIYDLHMYDGSPLRFGEKYHLEAFNRVVHSHENPAVVLDVFMSMTSARISENDNTAIKGLMNDLKSVEVPMVLVMHSGHGRIVGKDKVLADNSRARGASQFGQLAGCVWEVSKRADGISALMTRTKIKEGPDIERVATFEINHDHAALYRPKFVEPTEEPELPPFFSAIEPGLYSAADLKSAHEAFDGSAPRNIFARVEEYARQEGVTTNRVRKGQTQYMEVSK